MPRTLHPYLSQQIDRARFDPIRLATLTLYQSRYGPQPVPSVTLRLSDATRYLPRQTILDAWDRADATDLGSLWDPESGFAGHHLVGERVRVSAVNAAGTIETYNGLEPPRDCWGELPLAAWAGSVYKQAGISLRDQLPGDNSRYVAIAADDPGPASYIFRVNAGVVTTVAEEHVTVWGADALLWFWADGAWLRFFRDGVVVLEVKDTAAGRILTPGRVGLDLWVDVGGAVTDVEVGTFRAGSLREEYQSGVLSWGAMGDSLETVNPRAAPSSASPILTNRRALVGIDQDGAAVLVDQVSDLFPAYDSVGGDLTVELMAEGGIVGRDSLELFAGHVTEVRPISELEVSVHATSLEGSVVPLIEDAPAICDLLAGFWHGSFNGGANGDASTQQNLFTQTNPSVTDPLAAFGEFMSKVYNFCGGSLVRSDWHTLEAIYRNPATYPHRTLRVTLFAPDVYHATSQPCATGVEVPTVVTGDLVEFEPPTSVAQLQGYSVATPPVVKRVLRSWSHNLFGGSTNVVYDVDITGIVFFGVRLTTTPAVPPSGDRTHAFMNVNASMRDA